MAEFSLRPANGDDAPAIRRLIRAVQINPMGLDWRRFVVAVGPEGRLLGCGQLKPHGDGIMELASLAVEPEYRGQGIARALMDRLVVSGPRPLFLTARSGLQPFYAKWGFQMLELDEMPRYFRRLVKVFSLVTRLADQEERLIVMMLK
jgi:N-acetylglutamate synthase-like GNAT family acetyltransferase